MSQKKMKIVAGTCGHMRSGAVDLFAPYWHWTHWTVACRNL